MNNTTLYDLAIVGGGLNGVGIAADASSRGLKVLLCEKNDLASQTSSASSKLIHGGLRYLEHYEFNLVKQAIKEREILLKTAKHLVKPLTFILPYQEKLRSKLMLRAGLFLYDHLTQHSLPKSKMIRLRQHPAGKYLKSSMNIAFQYSDCQTMDSRLVIANAQQARLRGANILTYTDCTKISATPIQWELTLNDMRSNQSFSARAKILVNATGPFLNQFAEKLPIKMRHNIALIKGSHIIVPKLFEGPFAFIFQNADQRIIFVIPYQSFYHLIGTTDVPYAGDPEKAVISREEIHYLLASVNHYLSTPLSEKNILHSFSGVRPLLQNTETDSPSTLSRDYAIELNESQNYPPLLTILGGKLTTYRKLSEKAVDKISKFFPHIKPSQTFSTILPGSHYSNDEELKRQLENAYPALDRELLSRYQAQYGQETFNLLGNIRCVNQMGVHFGAGLYELEVDYLLEHEWARSASDLLWRRTKLGLLFPINKIDTLENYIKSQLLYKAKQ